MSSLFKRNRAANSPLPDPAPTGDRTASLPTPLPGSPLLGRRLGAGLTASPSLYELSARFRDEIDSQPSSRVVELDEPTDHHGYDPNPSDSPDAGNWSVNAAQTATTDSNLKPKSLFRPYPAGRQTEGTAATVAPETQHATSAATADNGLNPRPLFRKWPVVLKTEEPASTHDAGTPVDGNDPDPSDFRDEHTGLDDGNPVVAAAVEPERAEPLADQPGLSDVAEVSEVDVTPAPIPTAAPVATADSNLPDSPSSPAAPDAVVPEPAASPVEQPAPSDVAALSEVDEKPAPAATPDNDLPSCPGSPVGAEAVAPERATTPGAQPGLSDVAGLSEGDTTSAPIPTAAPAATADNDLPGGPASPAPAEAVAPEPATSPVDQPGLSDVAEVSEVDPEPTPDATPTATPKPASLWGRKATPVRPAPVLFQGTANKVPADKQQFADADEVADYLNTRHFVVPIGGKAVVGTEEKAHDGDYWSLSFGSPTDLKLLYANRFVEVENEKGDKKFKPIVDVWLSHERRRQYKGVVFSPGQEVEGRLNLFRGFAIQPRKGQCHLFWQHLFIVICRRNREHYRYIRKWLAHLLQRPAELPGVAIVIMGAQGSGKGLLVEHGIGRIIGPQHCLTVTQMDHLAGRFAGHLRDCVLLYANELHWGGDKTKEGAIKSMVTDTECVVEHKNRDAIAVRNYKRLFITTNSDRPVPLDLDDRRFLLLETDDSRVGDRQYFNALIHQMDNGGREALAYDLLRENLTGFDIRTKPASRFAFEVKLSNAAPHVRFWYERLFDAKSTSGYLQEDDDFWRNPSKEQLFQDYKEFCNDLGQRPTDKTHFGKELNKMLGGQLSERRGDAAEGVKRPWHHKLPAVSVCRKEFERYLKSGPEMWEGARMTRPTVR